MKNVSSKSEQKFQRVMHEFGQGELKSHGEKVTDQKQALAIAFNEARKVYPNYGMKMSGGNLQDLAIKGVFYLDAIEGKDFPGYTFGDDWNGWETPYFERPVANLIMEALGGTYKDGKYMFDDGYGGEEEYEKQTIDTVDGKKDVYAIGAYSWTWSSPEKKSFKFYFKDQPSIILQANSAEDADDLYRTLTTEGAAALGINSALYEGVEPEKIEEVPPSMKDGGGITPIRAAELAKIYSTGTAKELWGAWTPDNRMHFLMDHATEYFELMGDDFYKSSKAYSALTYDTLPSPIRKSLLIHHAQGMYGNGGGISRFWDSTKKHSKAAYEKSKELASKGYDKTKQGYNKAKAYTEKKIHDQKKNIALDVLDETRNNADTKADSRTLHIASNLVEDQYAGGGGVKGDQLQLLKDRLDTIAIDLEGEDEEMLARLRYDLMDDIDSEVANRMVTNFENNELNKISDKKMVDQIKKAIGNYRSTSMPKGAEVYLDVQRRKYVLIDKKTQDPWANEFFATPEEAKAFAKQNKLKVIDKPIDIQAGNFDYTSNKTLDALIESLSLGKGTTAANEKRLQKMLSDAKLEKQRRSDIKMNAGGGIPGQSRTKGPKFKIGDKVMVDDTGYAKKFEGFDLTKPATIRDSNKSKSGGKTYYFYKLEMANGDKPFNQAEENTLTLVSMSGGGGIDAYIESERSDMPSIHGKKFTEEEVKKMSDHDFVQIFKYNVGEKYQKNKTDFFSLKELRSKTTKMKLSPAKKKLLDRINTLKATKANAGEAAQKAIQKKIDVLQRQFDYNPSAKERAMANKGKFALDVPASYSKAMYKKLWALKIFPQIHKLNGTHSIVVNSKANLDKAYEVFSDMLKEKKEKVPSLPSISRKL